MPAPSLCVRFFDRLVEIGGTFCCALWAPATGDRDVRKSKRRPRSAEVGTRERTRARTANDARRPNARPARRSEDAENRTGNGAVRRASAPRRCKTV